MACDCINAMDATLAKFNTEFVRSFGFSRDGAKTPDTVTIQVTKVEKRKRGQIRVAPTFCPFCGVRYVPDPAHPGAAAHDAGRTGT